MQAEAKGWGVWELGGCSVQAPQVAPSVAAAAAPPPSTQVVKVYVSVYSDDLGKRRAIDNLSRLAP